MRIKPSRQGTQKYELQFQPLSPVRVSSSHTHILGVYLCFMSSLICSLRAVISSQGSWSTTRFVVCYLTGDLTDDFSLLANGAFISHILGKVSMLYVELAKQTNPGFLLSIGLPDFCQAFGRKPCFLWPLPPLWDFLCGSVGRGLVLLQRLLLDRAGSKRNDSLGGPRALVYSCWDFS